MAGRWEIRDNMSGILFIRQSSNVNPGLKKTKIPRLFNWEGTIKNVSDEMTIGGVPP